MVTQRQQRRAEYLDDLFAMHLFFLLQRHEFPSIAELRNWLLWRLDWVSDRRTQRWYDLFADAMRAQTAEMKDRWERGECVEGTEDADGTDEEEPVHEDADPHKPR